MNKLLLSLLGLLLLLTFPARAQYQLQEAYPALTFTNLIEVVPDHPAGDRLFAVTQGGIIYSFPENPAQATTTTQFLNIASRIVSGGERGLLGLAFHPNYAQNGYFYVYYTTGTQLEARVSRFSRSATNPLVADPASEVVLFATPKPYTNHNGGKIAFGHDGYLYISIGDGGSAGDPLNNAQNRTNLLGKILRIDVNNTSGGLAYAIPADNPYKDNTQGFREEIFAYGLRNPWRFSFDRANGRLWAADVGQYAREEINLITNGGNYGWRIMEGTLCYNPAANCPTGGLVLPVFEYVNSASTGESITGGFVYKGQQLPGMVGNYVYGDYITKKVWALSFNDNGTAAGNELLLTAPFSISTFAETRNGELLVIAYGAAGKIWRLTENVTNLPGELQEELTLYPNPASGKLNLAIGAGIQLKDIQLLIMNTNGQTVRQVKQVLSETVQVDLSGLAAGIYVLQVQQAGKEMKRYKVVIR
ncbi:PQQ-dependent sugar dehydrogenase [Botryobacter ruber]|uniref:PQQ-dependent sugar dehydrogenase n=1 Tax=Botryobacter ruber TaxID=2171629 RepID=UPI000E0BB3EF|nr:PQQ-dependent sugar dehydrogenase [Botryobacter ruber]